MSIWEWLPHKITTNLHVIHNHNIKYEQCRQYHTQSVMVYKGAVAVLWEVKWVFASTVSVATQQNKAFCGCCDKQVTWLPSPRSEVQALGWCWMRSTVFQIWLIFSSTEGYQLQISIPRAYFAYTVWHCTGQHCSSTYGCTTCRLFGGMWRPVVSVITTLYYTMLDMCMLFHCIAQKIFHKINFRAPSSYARLPLCEILFLSRPPLPS